MKIKDVLRYLVIFALPLDGVLIGDYPLYLPVLLFYILDRHVPKGHLHDFADDPRLIVLLVIEVQQTDLIQYLAAWFQDKCSAVLVREGQQVWLGECRHGHTRLGPIAIQGGEQDLLKQRELREIQGRVRQRTINHGPRLLQVEALKDLREEVQRATCEVGQKVRWGARCVILAKSFKLIKDPRNGEVVDVMARTLPVFRLDLTITTESPIDDFRVDCVDNLRRETKLLHRPRTVAFQQDIHLGNNVSEKEFSILL